jgi:hypothetical protein
VVDLAVMRKEYPKSLRTLSVNCNKQSPKKFKGKGSIGILIETCAVNEPISELAPYEGV